ncbi:MAG: dirigent protein [Actinomycetota bacterium]|nr:dirigent protein [Actinomycetota bacterium]
MKLKPTRLIAAGATVALSAAIAVPALTSAQSPGARTITVNLKVQNVAMDDVAPKSKRGPAGGVSLGDRLITRQSMFDPASKKRVGTLHTDCTGVGPTKPFPAVTLLCRVSYTFSDGQIVGAGSFRLDDENAEVPIVGGTGAYAGARGSFRSGQPAKGFDSTDVIAIAG